MPPQHWAVVLLACSLMGTSQPIPTGGGSSSRSWEPDAKPHCPIKTLT